MRPNKLVRCVLLAMLVFFCSSVAVLQGGEPVSLDNLVAPEPNKADEPLAEMFSTERAVHFQPSPCHIPTKLGFVRSPNS
jgi:hypothetical protein